nr:hypothetical protein [Bacteroidota bacterium]
MNTNSTYCGISSEVNKILHRAAGTDDNALPPWRWIKIIKQAVWRQRRHIAGSLATIK